MNRFIAAFAVFSICFAVIGGLSLFAGKAGAQMSSGLCSTQYEVIISLHPPRIGVPSVWDALYGQKDKHVHLYTGVPQEGGTVLVAGRVVGQESYEAESIVLAEVNRRARTLKEKTHPAKNGEVPVKMIEEGSGYVLLSNIKGAGKSRDRMMRLSWYDKDLKFLREKVIKEDGYNLEAMEIIKPSVGQAGIVVVAHATNPDREDDQHGVIMHLTATGNVLWKRAYRPGIPNQLYGLMAQEDGLYIATGRIRVDDGRKAGWVMKLGKEGTILNQRTFPRGASSVLKKAISYGDVKGRTYGYILMGDVEPVDSGHEAVWAMSINGFWEIEWQRYFRRADTGYSTVDVIRQDDGRLNFFLNASVKDGPERDHLRILTVSPRGVVIDDETYIEGVEAEGHQVIKGWNNERIVISTVLSDSKPIEFDIFGNEIEVEEEEVPPEEMVAEEVKEKDDPPVQEGWILVATALDPYRDPCAESDP